MLRGLFRLGPIGIAAVVALSLVTVAPAQDSPGGRTNTKSSERNNDRKRESGDKPTDTKSREKKPSTPPTCPECDAAHEKVRTAEDEQARLESEAAELGQQLRAAAEELRSAEEKLSKETARFNKMANDEDRDDRERARAVKEAEKGLKKLADAVKSSSGKKRDLEKRVKDLHGRIDAQEAKAEKLRKDYIECVQKKCPDELKKNDPKSHSPEEKGLPFPEKYKRNGSSEAEKPSDGKSREPQGGSSSADEERESGDRKASDSEPKKKGLFRRIFGKGD